MVKISPSILSVPEEKLEDEVKRLKECGADFVHIDVMDGKFVNNKTDGYKMLEVAHEFSNLPLDTHLMVENPENWMNDFLASDIITFHIEAVTNETFERIAEFLHERDIKVGIAIKPETKVCDIEEYLDKVDLVLVMLVEPGFGGQKMIESCLEKVELLRKIRPSLDIEVDGGVNLENVDRIKKAGANMIVAGTAIFGADDKKNIISKMKE